MKKQWSTVLIIALLLVVVLFAVLNVDPVSINFGFSTVSIPLVVVIIGTLLVGLLIAVVWSTTIVIGERNKQKKLKLRMETMQAENDAKKLERDEKHRAEKQELQTIIDKMAAENRELNRRIKNMETSRSISHNDI